MLILPCDVSVCVADHLLLWHWVCPWALGDSVQMCSSSHWESVQGEVCSAHPRPAHIFFYPQSTENASFPTTYLPHTQGTWLKSCVYWGSIRARRMNSGFNHFEIEIRIIWQVLSYGKSYLCFQFLYLCVMIQSFIILNFNYNIILYNAVSFRCAAKWISYIYTLLF